MRLTGCEIKIIRLIFATDLFIYHTEANLDEEILLDKITHHLDSEIRKMLVKSVFGSIDSTFHSGP